MSEPLPEQDACRIHVWMRVASMCALEAHGTASGRNLGGTEKRGDQVTSHGVNSAVAHEKYG